MLHENPRSCMAGPGVFTFMTPRCSAPPVKKERMSTGTPSGHVLHQSMAALAAQQRAES